MREWADFTVETDEKGGTSMVLTGPLLISSIGVLDRKLREWPGLVDRIDLSHVGAVDTVGAWIVWRFARDSGGQISGASEDARRLIEAVQGSQSEAEIEPQALIALMSVQSTLACRAAT